VRKSSSPGGVADRVPYICNGRS